jgi:4-amino-4-deoxy-L-arabinose transferase-like glycosyltransferase
MKPPKFSATFVGFIFYFYIYVFLVTILLSFFGLANRWLIGLGWIILAIFVFRSGEKIDLNFKINKTNIWIFILLFLTFVQGFFSAPNTTDSLVYHLPRVIHWIQYSSVFQSQIFNEHDFMPPFAEYLDMWFYQLIASDRLVFLSQWLAYLGSILISGQIGEKLGLAKKNIYLVRLFTATIPMAVMQATSTQTDLVSAFLLMIATNFSLDLRQEFRVKNFILLNIALALGILVKPTLAIFGIVPAGIFIFGLSREKLNSNFIRMFLITAAVYLVFLGGFFYQNLQLYHSLLGKDLTGFGELVFVNEKYSISGLLSSLIRNLMIHIPIPLFSSQLQVSIAEMLHFFGTEINDPQLTWYGTQFQILSILFPQEDLVGNPIQLGLFFIAFVILVRKSQKDKLLISIYVLISLAFFIFCYLLKWQPWNSRLHLPLFELMTIVSVVALQNFHKFLRIVLEFSYALALVLIVFNVSRPLISYDFINGFTSQFSGGYSTPKSIFSKPRIDQYFNSKPYWYGPYLNLAENLAPKNAQSKPESISISLMDSFEYPLIVMIKRKGDLPIIKKDSADKIIYTKDVPEENSVQTCFKTPTDYGFACIKDNINLNIKL